MAEVEKSEFGDFWVVIVDPGELAISSTRRWPYRSGIGMVDRRGKIRVWYPAAGAPRNWGKIARLRLEDARRELIRRGEIVERGDEQGDFFVLAIRPSRDPSRPSSKGPFGVFPHSSGERGGYVVRAMDELRDPYHRMTPVRVFKRRADADRYSDRLTFGKAGRDRARARTTTGLARGRMARDPERAGGVAPTAKNIEDFFGDWFRHEGYRPAARSRALARSLTSRDTVYAKLDQADKLINGHGVESIRSKEHGGGFWGDTVGVYVNTGDSYSPTILYDVPARRFLVTTYGDWVEAKSDEYKIR